MNKRNKRKNLIAAAAVALLGIMIISCAGCAEFKARLSRGPESRSKPRASETRTQQLKPADAQAQQRYYDRGLQFYSRERYRDARSAFQHVVDLGPNTELGQKAQENLRKIQQVLQTLEEIESK